MRGSTYNVRLISTILVVLRALGLHYYHVDCTLEAERQFADISRYIFDDEGPELTTDDVKRAIQAADQIVDLSRVELDIHDRDLQDLHSLESITNVRRGECNERNVIKIGKRIQRIGRDSARLLPILNNFRDQMINKCRDHIQSLVGPSLFVVQSNIDWMTLEAILNEHNLDLEAVLRLKLSKQEIPYRSELFEAFIQFLRTLEPMRKEPDQSWHEYRIKSIFRYDLLMNNMCKANRLLQVTLFTNLWKLDAEFYRIFDPAIRGLIERYIVCNIIIDYRLLTTADTFLALNYTSEEIYDLIFTVNRKQLMDPSEVHMLLLVLSNYAELSGRPVSRKQEIHMQTAQSFVIPSSQQCISEELNQFFSHANYQQLTNIVLYRSHYIFEYLSNCARSFVRKITEKASLLEFDNFVNHLVVGSKLLPIHRFPIVEQETIIKTLARVFVEKSIKLDRTKDDRKQEQLRIPLEFVDLMCKNAILTLSPIESQLNDMFSALDEYWHSLLWDLLTYDSRSIVMGIIACRNLDSIDPNQVYDAIVAILSSQPDLASSSVPATAHHHSDN